MTFFGHNVYDNVRTRVIVVHAGALLLLPPDQPGEGWRPPGGGLEPGESMAECARREALEETGIAVAVGRVAFLREWVAPTHCAPPDGGGRVGFGLEVFFYAAPAGPTIPRPESTAKQPPVWAPLAEVPAMPVWPIELKSLALRLAEGGRPQGVHSFVTDFFPPWTPSDAIVWE
ncbi:MAG TPA: NUDIX domain-containing protein [Herpetosiphonaceae bacterium]|nr:NUDIX domain-containing protein [Herpetosiphonaceae bacterium]